MSCRPLSGPPLAAAAKGQRRRPIFEVQQRRPVFTDATVRVLARAAGKELRVGANAGAIAACLDAAAMDYMLWSRSDQHATAGPTADWARRQAALAAEFLAGFGMAPDPGEV